MKILLYMKIRVKFAAIFYPIKIKTRKTKYYSFILLEGKETKHIYISTV